jgi:hypothetical protein
MPRVLDAAAASPFFLRQGRWWAWQALRPIDRARCRLRRRAPEATRSGARRRPLRRIAVVLAALLFACVAGCSDIAGPDWFAPGPARVQRTRAQRFDPYPDPEVGRDDGSARPRDYMNPPPEADRSIRSINPQTGAGILPDRWQASGP